IGAADGATSAVRQLRGGRVAVTTDLRPNRFVWLGTTRPFPAFTFYFRHTAHGLWRVHAYQYAPGRSTFIVECREETWRAAGMDTDRKSTRLNSSHVSISYAVFCLKKKKKNIDTYVPNICT